LSCSEFTVEFIILSTHFKDKSSSDPRRTGCLSLRKEDDKWTIQPRPCKERHGYICSSGIYMFIFNMLNVPRLIFNSIFYIGDGSFVQYGVLTFSGEVMAHEANLRWYHTLQVKSRTCPFILMKRARRTFNLD
jgi:hypothetical protein